MLRELAPNIFWMAPEHATDRPAMGAVAGDDSTLLVEPGASSRHAGKFLDALETSPVRYVLMPHSHWDHVFGASAIDAVTIATEQTKQLVETMADYSWSDEALDERVAAGTEIAFCRDMIKAELSPVERAALRIRIPETTFQSEMTIDLGNRSVQLPHVGGDHAPDSCIAVVPGEVAFLSDCIYPNIHVEPNCLTRRNLFPILDHLLALDVDTYVLGHHDLPLTREQFEV
ncbi:MAG: MBL fold metallo-hydrolase, partial [Planctomycetota bacterium]